MSTEFPGSNKITERTIPLEEKMMKNRISGIGNPAHYDRIIIRKDGSEIQ